MTFDEVFKIWLAAEVDQIEGRDILPVAQSKGFTSITEWRLTTALRLGMDKKQWVMETIENPNEALPNIIIGPYQGWQRLINNQLETTFGEAMEIPEFFEWCKTHDRIIPISENFPLPATFILYRRPDKKLIHIEGGHRICAVAYRKKLGIPIEFGDGEVTAAIADITDEDIPVLIERLKEGTEKK